MAAMVSCRVVITLALRSRQLRANVRQNLSAREQRCHKGRGGGRKLVLLTSWGEDQHGPHGGTDYAACRWFRLNPGQEQLLEVGDLPGEGGHRLFQVGPLQSIRQRQQGGHVHM